ncbi:hypothetical protein MCOR19_001151 [Pyricularia oryzae]|nr:hypothetical protein MCOR19_001151 [Pyricularia oryzae]KAI6311696.1 hypothetical protein MCOR34_005929 [Pyricularia oryzae]KAI6465381.1 hypothetical protein MCOR15_003377 [Pyricularia oryzae]KAI6465855.1 hypothetical protein MCOR18_010071 [Pyricularia oryzae]KAI6519773.1 hypothetical protein MCOR16_008504 [Pyricularia oryzae]
MKSFGILSTFVFTAAAAPLAPRQEAIQTTNFSAATVQGGPGASITFDVAFPSGPSTSCSYSDDTSGAALPDVSPYLACADDRVSWQFRRIVSRPGSDGFYLLVVRYSDGPLSRAGSREWQAAEFPVVVGGDGVQETVYSGPADFPLANA